MGVVAHVTLLYWLVPTAHRFANLPLPVAVGVLVFYGVVFGAYVGVFAWGLYFTRRHFGPYWPCVAAVLWTVCEFLTPQIFELGQGMAFYQQPRFFLIASVVGVPGITIQVVFWNALILAAYQSWRTSKTVGSLPILKQAAVAAALLVASVGYSSVRLNRIDHAEQNAETRRIALVQTNLDVAKRAKVNETGPTALLKVFLDLSADAIAKTPGIDAIVWAEGALPGAPQLPRNQLLLEFVAEHETEVWTGGHTWSPKVDGKRNRFNSAFRVFGNGEVDATYNKNILMPFGEYMPLADVLPFLRNIDGVGNNTPGERLNVYDAPFARFCFLICYEAVQQEYVRHAVQQSVDLLVNVTYDAWLGDTSFPHQHLAVAAIQSAQCGVPMVRAATTGISAFIDARGKITAQTQPFTRAVMVGDVARVRMPSIYAKYGDWFAWCFVVALVGLVVALFCRRCFPMGIRLRGQPSPVMATAFGILAIVLWSTSVGVTRRLAESLGPLTSSAWIYTGSGLIGCGILALRGRLRRTLAAPRSYLVGCGALFVVYLLSFCLAIGLASSSQQVIEVGLINYLWPGLTLVFGIPILGHRARPTLLLGLLLAFLGVYLATVSELPQTPADVASAGLSLWNDFIREPLPYLLALCAALAWSLYSNINQRFVAGSSIIAVPLFLLASGVALLLLRPFVEETSHFSAAVMVELSYMALLPGLLAYYLWDVAMRFGSAITVASLSYLIPLFSVLLICWWQDVPMRTSLWLACLLLIGGAVVCRVSVKA